MKAKSLHKPFISGDMHLPEITVKAVIPGILLAVIMAGANAYMGLFAGILIMLYAIYKAASNLRSGNE